MKPTLQLICLLSLLSQSALGAPPIDRNAQINLRDDGSSNLILSGQTLCDSNSFKIKIDSTGIAKSDYYISDAGKSSWNISADQVQCSNQAINMQIKKKALVPGKILKIITSYRTTVGNTITESPRHTFEFVVPCSEAQFASIFNGRWTRENTTNATELTCPAQPVRPVSPQPAPVVVAPPPQAPTGPTAAQAAASGRAQGNLMARHVFNYYGQFENKMFSYAYGLGAGMDEYRRIIGDESNSNPFKLGVTSGERFGTPKGTAAGSSAGEAAGSQLGSSYAVSRFQSVLDRKDANGTQMSANTVSPAAPSSAVPQFAPQCPTPISEIDAINQQNGIEYVKQMLLGYNFRAYEQGEIFDAQVAQNLQDYFANFSVSDFYSTMRAQQYRSANFANSYGNPDWGFSQWSNRSLQTQTSPYAISFFNSLNQDLQNQFTAAFKAAYVQRMQYDMDRYLNFQNLDQQFISFGQQNGEKVMEQMMSQHGVVSGCQTAFTAAATRAFLESYSLAFSSAFSSTANVYSTNPEIRDISVSINETSGRGYWLPGSGVSAVVNEIINDGAIPATLIVAAQKSEQVFPGAGDADAKVVANPLSKNARAQATARLSTLQNPPLNQTFYISVSVGSKAFSTPVTVTPDKVVLALVSTSSDANGQTWMNFYKQYLLRYLTNEWNENKGFSVFQGIYGKGTSILNQVSSAYQGLNQAQRQSFQQNFKPDLQKIFVNGNGKKTREVQAILTQMN